MHRSKYITIWLDASDIYCLTRATRSPDLNIFENVWMIVRHVDAHGRQYANINYLTDTIQATVVSIDLRTQTILYKSIPRWLIFVIKKGGASI